MKIGIFSDYYVPQINGVVAVIQILEKNLTRLGHEVVIFAPKPPRYKETKSNVVRFPAIQGLFYDDYLTSLFFPTLELRKIRRKNLDVVLVLTPSQVGLLGIAAARKFNIPLVTQYSTDVYEYIKLYPQAIPGVIALTGITSFSLEGGGRNLINIAHDLRNRRKTIISFSQSLIKNSITVLHNNCDAVIALSRKKYKQLKDWKTLSHVELLPTGVDPIPTTPAVETLREQLGIPKKAKIVLYAGRMAAEKNLDLLVECFDYVTNKFPDTYLLMVGDYEYRPVLEAIASQQKSSSKIIFTGAVPRTKLGDYYSISDLFVFPSITDTQGLVVHEAAGAGLPLIMIDREVSELLLPNKTGLISRNDPRSLANAILKILAMDKKSYKAMSQAVYKRSLEFSELKQTQKMIDLFEKVIKQKQSNK
ncbi:MAG: glycosyltransferase [Candidatus Saccharibacteria bacterium]|nr:glycosyltransferase [Candidatus Saccharibacteria bacterium]